MGVETGGNKGDLPSEARMPVAMSKAPDLVMIHQKIRYNKKKLGSFEIPSGNRAVGVLTFLGAQGHVLP